jgi:hypothetical protein
MTGRDRAEAAREEWEQWICGPPQNPNDAETERKADALIAALTAERDALAQELEDVTEQGLALCGLLEQAEAEVERLKCCGNCASCEMERTFGTGYHEDGHHMECQTPYTIGEDGEAASVTEWNGEFAHVRLSDPCHFTPSRWTRRKGQDG